MSSNVAFVQSQYAAFGRGDVPFILGSLTGDCQWVSNCGAATVPWDGARAGKAGATEF